MLALGFLHPLLLWGLPLCAVPIVIHLLNRRRHQTRPWAAMTFLLAAMQRNKKRLQMEQWLVLLLRTLAVLLLVLLVSRPLLDGGLGGGRTHHVALLDDSASMQQRSGSATLHAKAKDRLRAFAERLATNAAGDAFSLVRTSRPQQPDAWNLRVGPDLGQRVAALLQELPAGDGAPDLGAALAADVQRAAGVDGIARTEHHVFGDARARDWTTDDDKPAPALLAALVATKAAGERVFVHGAAGPPQDVAIVDVRLADRFAVAGAPAALAADVQNLGLDPAPAGSLAVEVDGQSRVVLAVPPLAPGERIAVPFVHTFAAGGPHRVDAQLEAADTYPLDDRRTLALDVRDKSRVLLVDGQPDEDDGETFFLQAALDAPESGVEPQVVTDGGLDDVDLAAFDAVWLCNVQAPAPALAERLAAFVAAGGGLVVWCGAQVDAAAWNERLWRGGAGPLPLPIGDIAGDPDRPEKAAFTAPEHPVADGVGEVLDLLFGSVVLAKRWLQLVDDGTSGATIVARIRDAEGPPLLAVRSIGQGGQAALCALSADKAWSNLPSTDLFVVLCHQLHRATARRSDLAGQNLLPDGSWRTALDAASLRLDATVRALRGDDERTFTAPEAQPPAPAQLVVPMAELRQLGAYEVELARHDGAPDKRLFARNPPLAESRLVGFAATDFARVYPAELRDRVTFVRDDDRAEAAAAGGEPWPLLAALLLACMLLETLLAWRFGRR